MRLSFEPPRDDEAPDTFVYDPEDPCPTCGGGLLMPGGHVAGPVDQAPILDRADVLTYTSPPLDADLEVTGPVSAVLYAATSATDTDWVVKLCEVRADERTLNVCDGILRASYRDSQEERSLLEPDTVERYEIDMWATSIVFSAGSRLRVLLTSSDFPRYDRNPNTGELGVEATSSVAATQRIFHEVGHRSHLRLPVMPGE
jgi:putative CocE/NonD family hydrolase